MLRENLKRGAELFRDYAEVGESTSTAAAAAEFVEKKIPEGLYGWGLSRTKYSIEGSVGEGRTSETPWIAVKRRDITSSVQRGAFVIYIYSADMRKVYLGLMLGCAYFEGSGRGQKTRIRKLANTFAQNLEIPNTFIKAEMPLNGSSERAKKYSLATICFKEYDVSYLPEDGELRLDFDMIMDVYHSLANLVGNRTLDLFFAYYEAVGDGLIDENERTISSKDSSDDLDETEIVDIPVAKQSPVYDFKGNKHYPRDKRKKEKALKRAEYLCEYDNSHFSFWTRNNETKMYVEAHHLIPLNESDEFEVSLDVEANIVSLCPNCHKKIHYGTVEERTKMFRELVNKRADRLRKCEIMQEGSPIEVMFRQSDQE